MAEKSKANLSKQEQTQSTAVTALQDELEALEAAEREAEGAFAREEQEEPEVNLTEEQAARRSRLEADAGARTAMIHDKLARAKRDVAAAERAERQAATDEAEAEADAAAAAELLATTNASVAEAEEGLRKATAEAAAAAAECAELQEKRDADTARAAELREAIHKASAQLVDLRAERGETERDAKLRLALEALQRQFPNVYGRVHELCEPVKRSYDTACAVALGKNLDAVVVDTEDTARECIKYLKQQRYAPQTFIPLDSIRPKAVPDRLRSLGGSLRPVLDQLKYEPRFEAAIRFAAADTLMCDGLEEARTLCYRSRAARQGDRFKVVTLDGTLINKGGLMTGGAADGSAFGPGSGSSGAGGSKWDQRKQDKVRKDLEASRAELQVVDRAPAQDAQKRERALARRRAAEATAEGLNATLDHLRGKAKAAGDRESARRADADDARRRATAAAADKARHEMAVADFTEKAREGGRDVFKALSEELGVDDLLAREEAVAARRRRREVARVEHARTTSRLRAQLQFEDRKGLPAALAKVERNLTEDRATRDRKADDLAKWQEEADAADAAVAEAKRALDDGAEAHATLEQEAKAAKGEVATMSAAAEALAKRLAATEAQMEGRRDERRAAFGRARLDELELPTLDAASDAVDHSEAARKLADVDEDNGGPEDEAHEGDEDEESGMRRGGKRGRKGQKAGRRTARKTAAATAGRATATPILLGASETFSPSGFIGTDTAEGQTPSVQPGREGGQSSALVQLVRIDFGGLTAEERADAGAEAVKLETELDEVMAQVRAMAPNLKAVAQYNELAERIKDSEAAFNKARADARDAGQRLDAITERRRDIFMTAFKSASTVRAAAAVLREGGEGVDFEGGRVGRGGGGRGSGRAEGEARWAGGLTCVCTAQSIDDIYKDLTRSESFPMGGTAALTLENTDAPFLHGTAWTSAVGAGECLTRAPAGAHATGIKFNTMPPAKRFREIDQLSGGERTVAALAFLFALWQVKPAPLFVMDELDAALDNVNVTRVAEYIKAQAESVQFITISLKDTFYDKSTGLVGVFRDVDSESSGAITFDLRSY